MTEAPPTTTLGTLASPKWDDAWLALVDLREQELGRRVCGAHTPAWTPCTLTSTHRNGRCRFHGGAIGIGAPRGNRNAWIHGLYSRRLQQCGTHCPLWEHCPMSGKDVLDLHPAERPHCVYEQDEYDTILATISEGGLGFQPKHQREPVPTPSQKRSERDTHGLEARATKAEDPLRVSAPPREPTLIERNVALFQVMLSRAQAALRVTRLTDEFQAEGHRYNARSVRVSALVQAQLHIARELRQWLKLLPGAEPHTKPKPAGKDSKSPEPDGPRGLPDRMKPILDEAEVVLEKLFGPNFMPGTPSSRTDSDPPPAPA